MRVITFAALLMLACFPVHAIDSGSPRFFIGDADGAIWEMSLPQGNLHKIPSNTAGHDAIAYLGRVSDSELFLQRSQWGINILDLTTGDERVISKQGSCPIFLEDRQDFVFVNYGLDSTIYTSDLSGNTNHLPIAMADEESLGSCIFKIGKNKFVYETYSLGATRHHIYDLVSGRSTWIETYGHELMLSIDEDRLIGMKDNKIMLLVKDGDGYRPTRKISTYSESRNLGLTRAYYFPKHYIKSLNALIIYEYEESVFGQDGRVWLYSFDKQSMEQLPIDITVTSATSFE